MQKSENLIKFQIVSEVSTREPLCILLRIINAQSQEELTLFIDLLQKLIFDEYLFCYYRTKGEQEKIPIKEDFSNELKSYIKSQSKNSPSLISTNSYGPFEFIQTDKGTSWIEGKYTEVQKTAESIIEKIELYRNNMGICPRNLHVLYPDYLEEISDPVAIFGSWWYLYDSKINDYLFGYFSFYGLLTVFNKTSKKWDKYNP